MPARRDASSWARLAPAILLAGLALPALPVSGEAAGQGLALTVHVGYQDVVKQGQWMPVSIDVRNGGPDFRGTVEIQPQGNALKGGLGAFYPTGSAVYVLPLTLPGGTAKHLRTFVASDFSGSPVTVRVAGGDGRSVASQTASATSTANLLVGVLSDDPTAFDEFAATRFPGGVSPQVVHLAKDDVPASAVLLGAFDLLAIDDFASDSLTATQRSAIEGYVAEGGSLLLGSGGAWRKTLAAMPAGLLPLHPAGTATLSSSAAMETGAPMEVATGPADGNAWLSEDGRPLILEKFVGGGLVTLATFDWAQEPAVTSSANRQLLRQVGLRSGFGTRSGPALGIGGGGGAGVWYGAGSSGSITQRSNNFTGALSNLPALDLPSLRLTGLLVLLYVLIVGPLNYLVLLRTGRRELAWITVPVIAVAFAGIAYGLALGTKGGSVQANQIAIVHLTGDGDQAYQETYTGIFAPTRGDYSIKVDGAQPAIAPLAAFSSGGAYVGGGMRVQPDQAQVDLLGVTAFTLRGYATESAVQAPALTASISLRNGRLVGSVHNGSRVGFTDGLVAFGNTYQRLGRLAPGADQQLDILVQTSNPGGIPLVNPFVNANVAADPISTGSQSARESQERAVILQSMLSSPWMQIASRLTPVLIAWTQDPLQSLQVNGISPRLQSESAVVLPIALAGPISGTVPAGLVTARLVDASGDVAFGPSSTVLNGASATYEMTLPLASGAHLTNATITSTNPYGAKVLGGQLLPPPSTAGGVTAPQGAATMTVEAWDWGTAGWIGVPLQDNASTALPDGSVSPSGTVRIRLTAGQTQDPAQMGILSLSGSVQ